jgi:hypothetical protein
MPFEQRSPNTMQTGSVPNMRRPFNPYMSRFLRNPPNQNAFQNADPNARFNRPVASGPHMPTPVPAPQPNPMYPDRPPIASTGGGMPPIASTGGGMPPIAPTGGVRPPIAPTGGVRPPIASTGGGMPPIASTGGGMPPIASTGGGLAPQPDNQPIPSTPLQPGPGPYFPNPGPFPTRPRQPDYRKYPGGFTSS